MTGLIITFAIIWVFGWVVTVLNTSVIQASGWKFVKGVALLFFIWWYVVFEMAMQDDI